jgi:hypothetical protein
MCISHVSIKTDSPDILCERFAFPSSGLRKSRILEKGQQSRFPKHNHEISVKKSLKGQEKQKFLNSFQKDRTKKGFYRVTENYMPQPGLMRMRKTSIDKNCLPSDVASITFAYFLNSAHRSLKYAIQFLLIQTPQNLLQRLKKWSSSARWIRSSFSLTVGNKYKSLVTKLGK